MPIFSSHKLGSHYWEYSPGQIIPDLSIILLKDYTFWSEAFQLVFSKNNVMQKKQNISKNSSFYLCIDKGWMTTKIDVFIFNIPEIKTAKT